MTKLDHRLFRNAADKNNSWFVIAPVGITFEDVLRPVFWGDVERVHGARIGEFDLMRVRARDNSFDVLLTVTARVTGGLHLEFFAGRKPT